jgi:hypothetical protein
MSQPTQLLLESLLEPSMNKIKRKESSNKPAQYLH